MELSLFQNRKVRHGSLLIDDSIKHKEIDRQNYQYCSHAALGLQRELR